MARTLPLLAAALALASAGPGDRPAGSQALQSETPRDVLDIATAAAAGDSAERVAARWEDRLEADPGDRAALLGLAALDVQLFRYAEAVGRYDDLISSAGADVDAFVRQALLGKADALRTQSRFEASDSVYQDVLRAARSAGDSILLAEALIGLGLARFRTHGPVHADSLMEVAARAIRGRSDRVEANLRCLRVPISGGLPAEALAGAEVAGRAGADRVRARCLWAAMNAYMVRGISDSAWVLAGEAIDEFRALRDRYSLAAALQWRGWYRSNVGDYGAARADLQEALVEAEASRNESAGGWAALALAGLAARLGDPVTASGRLDRAQAMFESQGDRLGLDGVQSLRRTLARMSGHEVDLTEPLGEPGRGGNALGYVNARTSRAEWALEEGDLDTAEEELRQAIDVARREGLTGWLRGAVALRAPLAIARGDLEEAEKVLTEDALSGPVQPPRAFGLRSQLALVMARRGDLDGAEELILRASDDLDAWRATLDDRRLRLRAFELAEIERGVASVVAELVTGGRIATAFHVVERRRARELLDQMVRARTMRETADGEPSSSGTRPIGTETSDLPAVQAAIPDSRIAVLEFFTGAVGEPSTLFVVTRDAAMGVRLPPVDSLRRSADRFVGLLRSGQDPAELSPALTAVFLGDAIRRLPPEVDRLVLVPDDALHRIPFDALPLAGDSLLVHRFGTSVAPSATVVTTLWSMEARRRVASTGDTEGVRLLAVGDPDFSGGDDRGSAETADYRSAFEAAGGLPRLRGSGREARLAARYSSHATVLLGPEASEAELRALDLRPYGILHFATHALVDPRAVTRTALALSAGRGDDGFLGPADLAELRLEADLVVLSACRSAGGVVVRGEGIQGITAPLLEAGTRAVVASHWRLDDDRAVAFVEDLYDALAAGEAVADALRSARLAALERGAPARDWAAFSAIGDPTVRVALRRPSRRAWWIYAAGLALALAALAEGARRMRRKPLG